MKYFSFVFMLIAAPSYAQSLCQPNEDYITGCELRNGKTVSFCSGSEGLTVYRYGRAGQVELAVTEPEAGTMQLSDESYSRGAASEYQATNGKYHYSFTDAIYGNNDASYLMLELEHRGYEVPWLNENSLSHHTISKSLTVSHENKGELTSLLCHDDSHFYGMPHNEGQYIHIMREVSNKYHTQWPESIPQCQADTRSCVAIYEDFKQEFALVYFLPVESSEYINHKAYLIKSATGAMAEISLSLFTTEATDHSLANAFHLTVDGQQTVVSLEPAS
ncbi:hypothetical protein PTW35_07625 [Photobacterium sp. DA100]|uniref:hypothetical protein n=1 Tax=Photobacterium sp. DA100 TaxID=3027472 RepID=UPI00247A9B1E|nr:hypothetical protein [Photobacterium sp. DA100]WEM43642.1 hypothetical protein PTW35_07625 [Photobacterium sp. DA100]